MENTIDEPPIYFSMGMLVHDDKLYVPNTDDHEIQIFDINNLELITDFTSPLQYPCATTNGFIDTTDCPYPSRNLPTSLSLLDEKIFVNYGFANNIQIYTEASYPQYQTNQYVSFMRTETLAASGSGTVLSLSLIHI